MAIHGAVSVLETCCRMGLAWTELHGYRWVRSTFIPAMKALDSTPITRRSGALLARAYHLLGDLHCVHDAPNASMAAYSRALRLNRRDAGLVQDIADVLFMVGRYKESSRYEEQSCRVDIGLRKQPLQAPSNCDRCIPRGRPLFVAGDPLWMAHEELARGHSQAALRLLKKARRRNAKQVLMRVFGALEDVGSVMKECFRIAKTAGAIEWCSTDWFFLPAALWEEPKFWETMLVMAARFSDLGLNSPSSEIQGPPELLARATTASWPRIHRIAIEFHLARTRADATVLRGLLHKFPKWSDCRIALYHLRCTGSPPTHDDLLLAFTKDGKR